MGSYRDLLKQTKQQIREVDTATAEELRTQPGAVVLDVREPDEYEQGAIPGSLHIPRGNLESNIESRIGDRDTPILVFCAAGIYNIAWGIHAAYNPQWLFRFTNLPLINHPEVFACLGMVVGLYGILYLEVARAPERGWLIAAVGLLGKILGAVQSPRA